MGHLSLLEHANFTFGIEGVSRSFLSQITRHRIASFSVQSQRYVSPDEGLNGFDYVIPPTILALGADAAAEYRSQMRTISGWYQAWQARLREGASDHTTVNEDARFVLPNAAATRLLVTMNARELLHFFELRACNRAQWEIRGVAFMMMELAYREAPALFERCGPKCLSTGCPEGAMSCGAPEQMARQFAEMKARVDAAR